MQEYVAGFLFSDEGDSVALVLKNRPAWQAGNYNAVGGKVEDDENAFDAMKREFKEEAGVELDWDYRFALSRANVYTVHFFSAHSTEALAQVRTMESEPVDILCTFNLPKNMIPNLNWIIPMLLDRTIRVPIVIEDIAGN